METNQIVFRRWEDLVFENRNKIYGAYVLRRTYANHLLSGLAVTIVFASAIFSLQGSSPKQVTMDGARIDLTKDDFIFTPLPPPPIKTKPTPPVHLPRTTKTRGPVVVTTEDVEAVEDFEPVVNFDFEEGIGTGDVAPIKGTGIFQLPEPAAVIEEGPVDFAEVMPHYEGGVEAMMNFIQKKIRYPRVPRQLGIDGTVYVSFVVAGDGSVTDVRIIKGVHPDYDEEAMRVISMLPLWKGGSHNGRPVSVKMVLPIKFSLR